MLKAYSSGILLAGLALAGPARSQTLDATFTPPASLYMPGTVTAPGPAQADGRWVVKEGAVSRQLAVE